MAATYRQITSLVKARQEFQGNSLRAQWHTGTVGKGKGDAFVPEDEARKYIVWSYQTPIAYAYENGELVVTEERFSKTTSRGQNLLRACK